MDFESFPSVVEYLNMLNSVEAAGDEIFHFEDRRWSHIEILIRLFQHFHL